VNCGYQTPGWQLGNPPQPGEKTHAVRILPHQRPGASAVSRRVSETNRPAHWHALSAARRIPKARMIS
jgi:hypothetical protein